MNLHEIRRELSGIELTGIFREWRFSKELRLEPCEDSATLHFWFYVPHRDTGVIDPFHMSMRMDHRYLFSMSRKEFHEYVHYHIMQAVIHEYKECYRVNGELMFDPHEGEKKESAA